MWRTERRSGDDRQLMDVSGLRARIALIVSTSHERVTPILRESWDISPESITPGIGEYVEALIDAAELDSPEPIVSYIKSLDRIWQADQFAIDPLIRSLFLVGDIARSMLTANDSPELDRRVEHLTRTAVEVLSQRSVSITLSRLVAEVEKHRAGERRLTSLHRVGTALGRDLDLDRALTLIAEESRDLIGADALGLRLATSNGELEFVTGIGEDTHTLRPYTLRIDDSLSGAVFSSGRSIRVDDVTVDARVSAHFREGSGRSLLIAPLLTRDRAIGIIGGTSSRIGAFTEEDQRLLELFADQAANAIENSRLYRQATDQIAELEMLHRVSRLVSSSLELDEIYQTLYDEVLQLMPADCFLVALAQPDGTYDVEFIVDGGQRYPPKRGIRLTPVVSEGLDEGSIVVREDVTRHPEYSEAHRFGDLTRPVRSLIAVPLIRGGKPIGMMSAQSYEFHDYREPEGRMLRTIANQAAVAIEHARIYQQAQNMAIAEERARLAREIHDTLAQGLIGIILCLERLDLSVDENDECLRPWIRRALDLSRSNLDEARRSVWDLRAAPLEGRTLLEAIGNLIASIEHDVEFEIRATLPPVLPPLSARVETAIFRVVQEAFSNTRKHSACSVLECHLEVAESDLVLNISDDGVGFDYDDQSVGPEHYGITTMRERIVQIGGTMAIDSGYGRGTSICVTLPIELAMHQESSGSNDVRSS